MAKYFHMNHGLRGCYMPDGEPTVLMCKTRRELKEAIANTANMLATETTQGLSKRAIAAFAAECWREAHKEKPAYLPYALAYQERGQIAKYPYGIFVSVANRREYLDYCNNTDADLP